ncbi:glyoxylate-induced protein [Cohnella endophytica]|uniref:Glyoxylate-induced protein n=1 Tax=Cohnella endophytica TaxID=2419778 RepID=A0A494XVL4_9BACL|nr:TIM barrel protein [Cohnella endophytica]RKP52986.1 glyoxylate-induced protein [Cohnella endophytica]
MKLSVCVDAVYNGRGFEESVRSIGELGYDTIEFWTWWDKDLDDVSRVVREAGVSIACFCTKFVSLVDSSKREEYIQGLEESIAAAKRLDCRALISQVGNELKDVSREEQRRSLVEGLKACVPLLEREGMTLLVEPLNLLVDHQGYYLASSEEAFGIVREVGSKHVKVLFDIYHQQITEGHLISTIQANIEWIGHFHAAGNPGRHELNFGEIHYPAVFDAIRVTGYEGYVGLEYFPLREPEEGLRELEWRAL